MVMVLDYSGLCQLAQLVYLLVNVLDIHLSTERQCTLLIHVIISVPISCNGDLFDVIAMIHSG